MAVHVFLSPHFDNAALSCGGLMHRLVRQGERVIIVTVMGGEPFTDSPENGEVPESGIDWYEARQRMSRRRQEDMIATRSLGAVFVHLPIVECCYRTAMFGDGTWTLLYPTEASYQGECNKADEARVLLLETPPITHESVAAVYAPLCIEGNVDHRLTRDWGLVLTGANKAPRLKFYEEFPAIQHKMALQRALDYYRRETPALTLTLELFPLSDEDVAAKMQALHCYAADLSADWQDAGQSAGQNAGAVEQIMRDYLQASGGDQPAERIWSAA